VHGTKTALAKVMLAILFLFVGIFAAGFGVGYGLREHISSYHSPLKRRLTRAASSFVKSIWLPAESGYRGALIGLLRRYPLLPLFPVHIRKC
jgi:hypothetical protein